MNDLKIGFIGAGGVAQPHLSNLSNMDGVQICAVCDTFSERAQETGAKFGAQVYADYKTMLQEQQLDACYVCVIPGVHGEVELDLARARVPFYIEKPVHLDLDACSRVLDELQAHPMVNSVGYHWRYGVGAQAAREFLGDKRVSLVEGAWYGGFVGAPWWRQMALSGGQLVEQSTHIVDMTRFLAGEVKSVYMAASSGAMSEIESYDIPDVSVVAMHFDSGAVGQITSGCIAGEHGGSRVEILLKGRDFQVWTNSDQARWSAETGKSEVKGGQEWAEQLGNGDHAFVAALRSGEQSGILSDYQSGAQTLAVTLAANASMKSGQPETVRRFV